MNDFDFSPERYLKKIKAYIARMPSLSTTVIKVLETCNDPAASANDLKRVILLDPVLTGCLLKLINSAYFSLGQPISSITRAIIMLGINTVKNLALSFTIMDNLKGKSACVAFTVDEFWRHSLGVGVVAKALAALREVPLTGQEAYFVAGLLHDLGKLPLHSQFPVEYARVCETVSDGRDALYRNEARYLGLDHGAVGRIIAEKWRLGEMLAESLAYHHNPDEGSGNNRTFISIIALANQMALHLNLGQAGDRLIDHEKIGLFMSELGLDWDMLTNLQDTASSEIERAKIFLEVVQNG